jgi:hypothetical protein
MADAKRLLDCSNLTGELKARPDGVWMVTVTASSQGLTLVRVSAQPEPFLTQNTPYTPPNTPSHILNTP